MSYGLQDGEGGASLVAEIYRTERAERAACAELVRAAGCACDFFAEGDARWTDCSFCQGRGYASPSPSVACAICHGQGTVVEIHDFRCPQALAEAIEKRGRAKEEG